MIVFLERFDDGAGRKIQLGQPAAVVFHLLDEFDRRLATGENARGCTRGQRSQGGPDLWFKLAGLQFALLQLCLEAPVQCFGMRQQELGQAMQVDAELVAQNVGGIGQLRRYFG